MAFPAAYYKGYFSSRLKSGAPAPKGVPPAVARRSQSGSQLRIEPRKEVRHKRPNCSKSPTKPHSSPSHFRQSPGTGRWPPEGRRARFALPALFYAVEIWRGKRAWDQHRRALEAQGERFTLGELAPPSVPDTQNLALAPMLKPLFNFARSPDRPLEWLYTNGLNRLERMSIGRRTRTTEGDPAVGNLDQGTFADFEACAPACTGETPTTSRRTQRAPRLRWCASPWPLSMPTSRDGVTCQRQQPSRRLGIRLRRVCQCPQLPLCGLRGPQVRAHLNQLWRFAGLPRQKVHFVSARRAHVGDLHPTPRLRQPLAGLSHARARSETQSALAQGWLRVKSPPAQTAPALAVSLDAGEMAAIVLASIVSSDVIRDAVQIWSWPVSSIRPQPTSAFSWIRVIRGSLLARFSTTHRVQPGVVDGDGCSLSVAFEDDVPGDGLHSLAFPVADSED